MGAIQLHPVPPTLAQLNDAFRRTLIGGRVVVTAGVVSLGASKVREILRRVTTFDRFTLDNDPFGERDFGSFVEDGATVFWKIDCYDANCIHGSPDPLDPAVTCRVLTVMCADEY